MRKNTAIQRRLHQYNLIDSAALAGTIIAAVLTTSKANRLLGDLKRCERADTNDCPPIL
jgi:hypothetical protein